MNKTITIYELLGLYKDGNIPNKIKYGNVYYQFKEEDNNYWAYDEPLFDKYFFEHCNLNNTVEIIEDNDKLEKISDSIYLPCELQEGSLDDCIVKELCKERNKINEIIDHINKIEEKLDEK